MYVAAGKTTTPETYQKLRQAAKDVHPEQRAAVDHANVAIMVCLELYDSKNLHAMVVHKPFLRK
jgi:hypothetical protein